MAVGFIIGFLTGVLFSFVLANFLSKALEKSLNNVLKNNKDELTDDDPANWWKRDRQLDEDDEW